MIFCKITTTKFQEYVFHDQEAKFVTFFYLLFMKHYRKQLHIFENITYKSYINSSLCMVFKHFRRYNALEAV